MARRKIAKKTTRRAQDEERELEASRVAEDAREYAELRHAEREYESRRKELGSNLLPRMKAVKVGRLSMDFDENTRAVVRIKERENVQFDEAKLRKAIGAKAFNKLLSTFLDEAKIEAAIQLGELDPNVVAQCMDTDMTEYLEVRFPPKRKKKTDE